MYKTKQYDANFFFTFSMSFASKKERNAFRVINIISIFSCLNKNKKMKNKLIRNKLYKFSLTLSLSLFYSRLFWIVAIFVWKKNIYLLNGAYYRLIFSFSSSFASSAKYKNCVYTHLKFSLFSIDYSAYFSQLTIFVYTVYLNIYIRGKDIYILNKISIYNMFFF
jgi:hypothetical protein